MTYKKIIFGFNDKTLPKSEWTHEAHLVVGLWHAFSFSNLKALNLMREKIKAFNETTGTENSENSGYHETITRFWLVISRHFIEQNPDIIDFDEIKRKLYSVTLIEKPNERGFEFEKFLNYFFEQFRLNPRPSYKIIGEQIDGSFSFNNCTYLVEAKWKKEIIGIDDLRIFSDKIISKSAFTRGLFISFSNFNDYIFQRYNNNHARFILMTVQELFILAERKMDFKELLIKKIRVLEEEGIVFRNIMELN